jgi:hypothetical protein
MSKPKTIRAKRIGIVTPRDSEVEGEPPKLILTYVRDDSKEMRVQISKELFNRIDTQKLMRDHDHIFTLFLDDKGVAVDLDTELKNSNLPMEVTPTHEEQSNEKKVILEKNRANVVTVRRNIGGVAAEVVKGMQEAVQAKIDADEVIERHDILEGGYFVSKVQGDRYIHVELEH